MELAFLEIKVDAVISAIELQLDQLKTMKLSLSDLKDSLQKKSF